MMTNKPKVSYKRAPTRELFELLKSGGFLEPLVALNKREVCDSELDVHLRVNDEVHIYCGRTAILKVKMLKSPRGKVSLSASDTYKKQSCANGLFKQWKIGDPKLCKKIKAYFDEVEVNSSFVKGEGAVQTMWSQVKHPWIPFDREAPFGGGITGYHNESAIDADLCQIQANARQFNWKEPEKGAKKLDQLAIDSKGHLVLLELKDGSRSNDKVYNVPFQLLEYIWEWYYTLNEVPSLWDDLQSLINVRKKLGLTPECVPPLSRDIRAVVGFGEKIPTAKTKERYKKVLEIVNQPQHLPPGVPHIETWAFKNGRPCSLKW